MSDENDIVYRLRKRAEIRRKLDRGDGKPDRIANLCDEAASEIENLRKQKDYYEALADDLRYD